MDKRSDPIYLLKDQYKNADKLNARIEIHRRFSTNQYGWMEWVFDQFTLPPQSRILEVGCGPAGLWLSNVTRIPEGWDITLSDFSPGMLEVARAKLSESKRPFTFQLIDAQSIPFADEHFDAVIANHMLYHVPDRAKALSEIQRVLKPEGKLYATTVGLQHMRELGELAVRFNSEAAALWRSFAPHSFVLENGATDLAPWFSKITMKEYEDSLVVTDVDILVGYILSTVVGSAIQGEKIAQLAQFITQEIATKGAIYITKSSGIFEVTK